MTTYKGRRGGDGSAIVEVERPPVEGRRPELGFLNPRHDLWRHSPTGFEWGFGGSGPAQLALALLADALVERALGRALSPYERIPAGSDEELQAGPKMDAAARAAVEDADRRAVAIHQHFKFDVVAELGHGSWALTSDQVLAWVEAFEARDGESCAGCGGVHP